MTRQPSAAEHHDSIAPAAFDDAIGQGAFAFWWEAHGLKYALPATIDAQITRGHTVVCNVSRGILSAVRSRYAHVTVVLVTAPQEVLAARLGARGREGGGAVTERIARAAPDIEDLAPDVVIENIGDPHDGAQHLAAVLRLATSG